MSAKGKVQVVVQSRQVPARTATVDHQRISYSGVLMTVETNRVLIYEAALDEEHLRALDDGKRLAEEMGLPFEVVDKSRSNFLRRIASWLGRSKSGSPRLVITRSYSPAAGVASSCELGSPC
ncbi:MAG: hypothetical protein KGI38_01215 [Thaumarchaeota archaeon]|nr:hypothetical protein [Nitrososphaerota archaeon]